MSHAERFLSRMVYGCVTFSMMSFSLAVQMKLHTVDGRSITCWSFVIVIRMPQSKYTVDLATVFLAGYLAGLAALAAGVRLAMDWIERLARPGSTSARWRRIRILAGGSFRLPRR